MPDAGTLVLALAIVAGFGWLLSLAVGAERHSRFVARWVDFLAVEWHERRFRAARRLLPFLLFIAEFLAGAAAMLLLAGRYRQQPGPPPAPIVALLILWLVGFAALGLATIVVARTGRPTWLVMKPIRGMTPDQIEDWIDTHADWEQVPRARRRRRA